MRGLAAVAVVTLSLSACAGAPGGRSAWLAPAANPSRVIATEIAFARMAREEGTWTAFREYATEDALWPSPSLVNAQAELRNMADPAEPIIWGPDAVWSSCDGSFAVSTGGARYPDGRRTRFVTVWQRQNNGEYRWVLDQGVDDATAEPVAEAIQATVADCPATRARGTARTRRGENWGSSRSDDATLAWTTQLASDCSRTVTVGMVQDGAMQQVFGGTARAPAGVAANACAS